MQISSLLNLYAPANKPGKAAPIPPALNPAANTKPVENSAAAATATPLISQDMAQTFLNEQEVEQDTVLAISGDSPEELLKEITSGGLGGLWKWQMKELQEKIREEVMAEMNITEDQLNAMEGPARSATESRIMQIVQERLRQAVEEQMAKEKGVPFASVNVNTDITALLA